MDFFKNLPLAVRVAVPAVVGLVVLFLVYSMMLKPPAPVTVVKSTDVGVYDAGRSVLDHNNITYTQVAKADGSSFELTVAEKDKDAAVTALAKSGIRDRSGNAKTISCPAAPGFTGTRAQNDRVDNCEAAKAVQAMLMTAGASAANVRVSQSESDTLLGPDKLTSIMAQVFLPTSMSNWNAGAAAAAIAASVDGATIDRVVITDDRLNNLFNGTTDSAATTGSGAMARGATTGSDASASACDDMATATEIATKETAVGNCKKSQIKTALNQLLGSETYSVLNVVATIDGTQRMTTATRTSKGTVTSNSSQKGGGTTANNSQTEPSTSETSTVDPAGDISRLSISVALDANHVTPKQQLAVSQLLSSYVSASRKDPAPSVTRYAFPTAAAGAAPAKEEMASIKDQAQANGDQLGADTRPTIQTKRETPGAMLALMAVLVIGIVTAILILWRRSQRMSVERARYEAEFRNQQQVLDTYAQQDPAALAADLERMFGAPSAPEPAMRG